MKKSLPIIIVLIILIAIAVIAFMNLNNDDENTNTAMQGDAMMEKNTNTDVGESDSNVNTAVEDQAVKEDSASGKYVDYSSSTYEAESGKKRVIFFHAGWCPTCIVANTEFEKRIDEIPQDVVILKTDYDTEKSLKEKYDITYQHTFVQVDENGNELVKWNGGDVDLLNRKVQ